MAKEIGPKEQQMRDWRLKAAEARESEAKAKKPAPAKRKGKK